jgi:hypothetical protein
MHRGSRSHAVKRAQGTKLASTIACRPGLITIKGDSGAELKFLVQRIAIRGIGMLSTNRFYTRILLGEASEAISKFSARLVYGGVCEICAEWPLQAEVVSL